jgi:hypothetical protein
MRKGGRPLAAMSVANGSYCGEEVGPNVRPERKQITRGKKVVTKNEQEERGPEGLDPLIPRSRPVTAGTAYAATRDQ